MCVHFVITALNSTGSDEEPSPIGLRVTNCNDPPCKFVRGKEMAAEVDFIPGELQNQQIRNYGKTQISNKITYSSK
jgi:hypothetical protein